MEQIALATTGRTTSRLGFGSSALMGSVGRGASLALLESAFETGIRHFDTAPMYGYGEAERVVGEFLRRHPGACTVTTKFGIPPGTLSVKRRVARAVAGPLMRAFPGLKKRLRGQPPALAQPPEQQPNAVRNPLFTPERARAGLDGSLRALGLERIDVWLLHEAHAADLAGNDGLLRTLEDAVAAGKVGTFGVGSEPWDVAEIVRTHPAYCPVTQYEWSALDAEIGPTPQFRIHHRALSGRFQALEAMLEGDPALRQRWSEKVGADLGERGMLARLMLKASAVMNPGCLLLFSSTQPGNIAGNVRTMDEEALAGPARQLHELLRREALGSTVPAHGT